MNIAIITENFIGFKSKTLFSGAEILLFELTQVLINNGHSVTVFQTGDYDEEFQFNGVKVKKIRVPNLSLLSKFGLYKRFHFMGFFIRSKINLKTFDWIHFHYYFLSFPFSYGNYTGMSHGIEWDDPDQYMHGLRALRDRFSNYLMKRITKSILKNIQFLISNDYNFLKYIESNIPHFRHKIYYIPNFVDTSIFKPMTTNDSNDTSFKILIPKFITKERGQELFIKGLIKLPLIYRNKIKLFLLGHYDEKSKYHKYIIELINSNSLKDNVIFLGHKDHYKELPTLINSADLIAVPSYCREGTSLSVLEAMASKKLVLATNIGALPELVINNFTGFLCTPTPNDITKKLIEILNTDDTKKSIIKDNAFSLVNSNYSKKVWEKRWIDFLEKINK